MELTQKETSLLKDLKGQEELCVQKYGRYADDACDPCLKGLFSSIKSTEESHLQTIERILGGEEVSTQTPPSAVSQRFVCQPGKCSPEQKKSDAYLCGDALAMEKHASSLYDVSIFEFSDPVLRDTLNGLQKEEQNHGQQIYDYMSANGLYN